LRALEAHEFPMSFNTVVLAGTRKELVVEVAKTVPPRKKNSKKKERKKFWSKYVFDQLFFSRFGNSGH